MPITFDCACGKTLRVSDQHAGKRVKCPACNGVASVPEAEPEPMFEIVEDPAAPPPAPKAPLRGKPVPARFDDDDDEDDRRGYGVSKSRRDDEEDEEEEKPKPKKKKKIKARRPPRDEYDDRSGNTNSTSATREIIGGLFAILFGGALCAYAGSRGGVSPYGIILFICGVVGLLKGLAGGSGDH